tara:strand:- start:88 stop:477 length:390 start_codon:yes stop_codon:yes gene_type:complete
MVKIYCIEDINDLKYVGSTGQKLSKRLNGHKGDLYHRRGCNCSSNKINLYNCIIYELEECEQSERKERERYWINKIDCVNMKKLNGMNMDNHKKLNQRWYQNNKEKMKEYQHVYYLKRKSKYHYINENP